MASCRLTVCTVKYSAQYSCSVAEDQNTLVDCYRFDQFLMQGIMHSLPTVTFCGLGIFVVLSCAEKNNYYFRSIRSVCTKSCRSS